METEYREFKIYGYFYTRTHSIFLRFRLKSVYSPQNMRIIEATIYMIQINFAQIELTFIHNLPILKQIAGTRQKHFFSLCKLQEDNYCIFCILQIAEQSLNLFFSFCMLQKQN